MLEKQAEDFRKMRSGDMKAFERLFVSLYPGSVSYTHLTLPTIA